MQDALMWNQTFYLSYMYTEINNFMVS